MLSFSSSDVRFVPLHWLLFFRAPGPPEPLCTILRIRSEGQLHEIREVPFQVWRQASSRTQGEESSTLSLEPFVEPVRHLVHGLRRQTLQHFRHATVGGPIGLVPRHLPSSTGNFVNCDLHPTLMESCTAIATNPLTPDPPSFCTSDVSALSS